LALHAKVYQLDLGLLFSQQTAITSSRQTLLPASLFYKSWSVWTKD